MAVVYPRGTTHLTDSAPSIRRTTSWPTSDKALKRRLSRAESKVRIQLPPARSQLRTWLPRLGRRKFHVVTNSQQPSRCRGDSQRQTADTFSLQPYLISRSFCGW